MSNIPGIFTGFFDWILQSIVHDPGNPFFFTGGFFLLFFLLFFLVYVPLGRTPRSRAIVILFFSLWFYYKCSGVFISVILLAGTMNYLVARAIDATEKSRHRTLLLFCGIMINLLLLTTFKYTPYFRKFAELISAGQWNFAAFVFPAGLSFYTFANLSYIIDVKRKLLKPEHSLLMYLTYISFFPIVQMGPIERAKNFLPQLFKPYRLSNEDVTEGFSLILSGALKKMVIGDYINLHLVTQVFSMPERHTGMENLAAMLGYSLVIYCDFSGYTDMARGIARWMGFRIQVNFNFPYRSENIGDFWRRWHISLSEWLRDYIFLPLAFMFSRLTKKDHLFSLEFLRTDLVIFGFSSLITFTLCGLWHGIGVNFLIWGVMHGVALAIQKSWSYYTKGYVRKRSLKWKELYRVAGMILTFSFVNISWIFFRERSPEGSLVIFTQILDNFYLQGFTAFVTAYYPVLLMILAGFMLHFIPEKVYNAWKQRLIPMHWLWKTLIAITAIAIIVYFKSLGSAMPIYIQF